MNYKFGTINEIQLINSVPKMTHIKNAVGFMNIYAKNTVIFAGDILTTRVRRLSTLRISSLRQKIDKNVIFSHPFAVQRNGGLLNLEDNFKQYSQKSKEKKKILRVGKKDKCSIGTSANFLFIHSFI